MEAPAVDLLSSTTTWGTRGHINNTSDFDGLGYNKSFNVIEKVTQHGMGEPCKSV